MAGDVARWLSDALSTDPASPGEAGLQPSGPASPTAGEGNVPGEMDDGAGDEIRFASKRDRGWALGFRYALTRFLLGVTGITFFDFRVFGVHSIPMTGSVLVASTHQSVMDPCILGMIPERSNSFLAKQSLFRVPFLAWLIRKYDAFPIPKENLVPRKALDLCVRILRRGRSLIMFPEGTRSTDGRIQPLKRGVALVAKRSGAAVVPTVILGAGACWPRGARFPRPGKVRVRYGEPIRFEPEEAADSFIRRLSDTYRRLALEAGAVEAVHGNHCVGEGEEGGKEPPPSPVQHGEPSGLPQTAGGDSLVDCTTPVGAHGLGAP